MQLLTEAWMWLAANRTELLCLFIPAVLTILVVLSTRE
jgi:hypothetical protein